MNDYDTIINARKRYNIFFSAVCFFKTIKRNILKFPWFYLVTEHSYKEVSVNKETAKALFNKGIVIGDGDLICTTCGAISHNMVESEEYPGHSYCQSENCACYHTNFLAKVSLEADRIFNEIQNILQRK